MKTYNDVLAEIQSFSLHEKLRLLDDLKQLLGDVINDDDIESELLDLSSTAWQDYVAGKDQGISSQLPPLATGSRGYTDKTHLRGLRSKLS
ncbi:MAG: hypothetical protein HCA25_16180 [Dolichospermum sp. DET50]|nr:hypothetical protein [Dolichospermum sp. DET66]MBS3033767.1 hypothetical protein [Dolichospermum sp. DET67]MBS3038970.1 hypothetical protein [Dolichospermum sp. DET50]QSX66224.1 MAG: hypothetical protein EZY12_15445 [Dolichospermum sp. DET69]